MCVSRPDLPPVCAGTIWSADADDIEGTDVEWPGPGEPLELPAYVAESLGEMKVFQEEFRRPQYLLMQDGRLRMLIADAARIGPAVLLSEAWDPNGPPVVLPVGTCHGWYDLLHDVDELSPGGWGLVAVTSTGAHYALRPTLGAPDRAPELDCGEEFNSHGFKRAPEHDGFYYPFGYDDVRRRPDGEYELKEPRGNWFPLDPPMRSPMTRSRYVATDGRIMAYNGRPGGDRRVSQHLRGRCALDEQGRGFSVEPDAELPALDGALWVDECCGFFADGVVRCPFKTAGDPSGVFELPLDL